MITDFKMSASAMSDYGGRFEGIGEYQFPGDSARERGRRLFFSAMAQVKPEILESLADGPYRVALECGIDLSGESPSPQKEILAAVRRVRKATRAWCTRWGLIDSWCEDLASDTVFGWARNPESKFRWAAEDSEWIADASFPRFRSFKFKFSAWSYALQTWNDFKADAWAAYRKYLAEYRQEAERAVAEDRGSTRTKSKRKPVHYFWLVRYLLLGQSASEIANFDVGAPSAGAVLKAINRLARDIGLSLPKRPAKP